MVCEKGLYAQKKNERAIKMARSAHDGSVFVCYHKYRASAYSTLAKALRCGSISSR